MMKNAVDEVEVEVFLHLLEDYLKPTEKPDGYPSSDDEWNLTAYGWSIEHAMEHIKGFREKHNIPRKEYLDEVQERSRTIVAESD